MIPKKLRQGDHIRIISPSNSLLPKLAPEIIERGIKRLNEMGLSVSFGKHIREVDEFKSTSVKHRLQDLHDAFLDNVVDGGSSPQGMYKF